MARFLLDTNILSEAVHEPQGSLAQRLAGMPPELICTSIIVAAELRYGAAWKRSRRLFYAVEEVSQPLMCYRSIHQQMQSMAIFAPGWRRLAHLWLPTTS